MFGREGFTIWNGQWYGGHHTPAYSVLSPPLGWLLGVQMVGALSSVGATIAFTELAWRHWGARAARWGTIWFGVGSATLLATNRIPSGLTTLIRSPRRYGATGCGAPADSASRMLISGALPNLDNRVIDRCCVKLDPEQVKPLCPVMWGTSRPQGKKFCASAVASVGASGSRGSKVA